MWDAGLLKETRCPPCSQRLTTDQATHSTETAVTCPGFRGGLEPRGQAEFKAASGTLHSQAHIHPRPGLLAQARL